VQSLPIINILDEVANSPLGILYGFVLPEVNLLIFLIYRLLSIPFGDMLALSDTLATLSHFV